MHRTALAIVFALSVSVAPAHAQSPGQQLDSAVEHVLDLLRTLLRSVPMYEAPEVLPNGDIIIRRVPPKPEPRPQPQPEQAPPNSTRT